MTNGCLGLGNTIDDFLVGGDVSVDEIIKEALTLDRVRVCYDQSRSPYTHACTFMSTIGVICSIRNITLTSEQLLSLLEYCKKNGYVVGRGWFVTLGVKYACQWWNLNFPDKKVLYFLIDTTSGSCKKALDKGYGIVTNFSGNTAYNIDKYDNRVIDGVEFPNSTYGHAISGYKSDLFSLMHLDTYPRGKVNQYDLRDHKALVENHVYGKYGFLITKDIEGMKAEIQKKKFEDELQLAYDRGITNDPSPTYEKKQIAVMIVRSMKLLGYKPSNDIVLSDN